MVSYIFKLIDQGDKFMAMGIKGILLVLCFLVIGISVAGAQQSTPGNNPNIARIEQLKQEIQGLQKQVGPLYSQIKQLVSQIKSIKEQIHPLEEKMKSDREQIRSLVENHGGNQ